MITATKKSIETAFLLPVKAKSMDFYVLIRYIGMHRGVAQHGLAHLLGVQEAAGSNPVAPIFYLQDRVLFAYPSNQ